MREPRLRNVNKAKAPYEINCFPKKFIRTFAEDVICMMATKSSMSLEGDEWERIFADCIGAEWKPSNVGLDDVQLLNCCWSAKTVKASSKDLSHQKQVRLISRRNSPTYSFGVDKITEADPNYIGKLVLEIWNERVSAIRQIFKFARTVVLIKGQDYSEYIIFEDDTVRYEADLYYFKWNARGNLEGYAKSDNSHKFTWQPHGSQFTIVEDVPDDRLHIKLSKPEKFSKDQILKLLSFDDSWYSVVK